MKSSIVALLLALAGASPSMAADTKEEMTQTSNPPAEIQTLIDAHIKGFNTQDNELFLSVFGDTAIIIDGIAPYRWLNPNAPANWLADVKKWRQNLGVTSEHLAYEMRFWNVEGSSAYAVVSGTLTITVKGQSLVRTGTLRTRSQSAMASGRLRLRLGAARRSRRATSACGDCR